MRNWISGLKPCGKSCRIRWLNHLRPDIKQAGFTEDEDDIICTLFNHRKQASVKMWSVIASKLSGRTDNDVQNHWNPKPKKSLLKQMASLKTLPESNLSHQDWARNLIIDPATKNRQYGDISIVLDFSYVPLSTPEVLSHSHSNSVAMKSCYSESANGGSEQDQVLLDFDYDSMLNDFGFQDQSI
ncbi:hypothetical protein ACJRO7_016170 [Eucalyptus globulus]|uniref:Uncharacterized protein n=1 Tax=Eucalyptus globulus TaxID=34317 RepID=A0ABD3LGC7_EUCGL